MGTSEMKDAFNSISDVKASTALLWTERDEKGKEWQKISFRGTTPTGEAFEATTDRHHPNADPVLIALDVATKFVEARAKEAK